MTTLARKFRFTQREIDRLPPCPLDARSKSYECSDAEVTGLRIMVTKSGRKFWFLRYNLMGRKRAVKIGESPATDLGAARKRALEMRAQVDAGIDPHDEIDHRRQIPTFSEFAYRDYLPLSEQTLKSHKDNVSRLTIHLLPKLGSKRLTDITTREVQALVSEVAKNYSQSTANRVLSLLARMMKLATLWTIIERNPCIGIKKFRETRGRERFLNGEELARLYRALECDVNVIATAAIKFLLLTGMRRNEAIQAKWSQVDLEHGLFHLPMTKSGKSRHVVLSPQAMEVLLALPSRGTNAYVFPGTLGDRPMTFIDRAFRRVMARAGIEKMRIHDLRHSYASIMANSGVSLFVIQRALGHASPMMTQRYSHLCDEALVTATAGVGDVIDRATKQPIPDTVATSGHAV